MPLKISLCDDEPHQISQMKTLLHEWSTNNNTEIETHEYSSAEQFLFDYETNACDLLLLDIEMTGLNGMELAKSLRAKGDLLPIVFITGFSEYMSDGYDVEALHYLLKPVKKEKLFEVLNRYIAKCRTSPQFLRPCEKISVNSKTVIKNDIASGLKNSRSDFFTVYNGYCNLSRFFGYQPAGMERSGMESG